MTLINMTLRLTKSLLRIYLRKLSIVKLRVFLTRVDQASLVKHMMMEVGGSFSTGNRSRKILMAPLMILAGRLADPGGVDPDPDPTLEKNRIRYGP